MMQVRRHFRAAFRPVNRAKYAIWSRMESAAPDFDPPALSHSTDWALTTYTVVQVLEKAVDAATYEGSPSGPSTMAHPPHRGR